MRDESWRTPDDLVDGASDQVYSTRRDAHLRQTNIADFQQVDDSSAPKQEKRTDNIKENIGFLDDSQTSGDNSRCIARAEFRRIYSALMIHLARDPTSVA